MFSLLGEKSKSMSIYCYIKITQINFKDKKT